MADNWWGGSEESGGPSDDDFRKAGWFYRTDRETWEPPEGWQFAPSAPGGYAPPTLLDQPKQVSVDYILKNHPTLAGLPQHVLQAMAQNWQQAYSQLAQYSPKQLRSADIPEGYAPAKIRNIEGQLVLSYGGPQEMFSEAAPYISYSPEYGLVVPEQGIRAPEWGGGLGRFMPAIIGGLTLGPLAGALGGGALGAAASGAITGGATSAMTGGNALKGALTGGLTGGLGAAATPVIGSALQSAGITGLASDVLTKAAVSAGTAAVRGGDPLQAALSAAVGTGVGGAVSGLDLLKDLDPAIAKAITAAASNAAKAAVTGGDPVMSALTGVADAGFSTAMAALNPATERPQSEARPETPAPVEFEYGEAPIFEPIDPEKIAATPTEKWIDQGFLVNEATPSIESLLAELGQREEERAGMQSALLGYDPRIISALESNEADQAALQALLSGGQQLGKTAIGGASVAAAPQAPTATQAQQAGGVDSGSLLALLGLAQQQQKEPPPVQMVGEIKPFDFSTDLLEGIYNQPKSSSYGSNDELLRMMRGG